MDRIVREQAINFFFKPTKVLMRRYGRYADLNEVATFQRRFDDLENELVSAFDNGEALRGTSDQGRAKEAVW